jgi:hypothetical protein
VEAGQVGRQGAVDDGGEAVLEPFLGARGVRAHGAGLHDEAVPLQGEGSGAPPPVAGGPAVDGQGEDVEGPGPEMPAGRIG